MSLRNIIGRILIRGIHIPDTQIHFNPILRRWHHGDRVNPNNWPWWIRCRFSLVIVNSNPFGRLGAAHPPDPTPRYYRRIYCYTRQRAIDLDIRIQ